ncbi:polyketide synthase, partial [Streptomyces sp. HSW2009]
GLRGVGHGLLGAVVEVPGSGGVVVSGRLSVREQGWLGEHRVQGRVVVPGTALVEMAICAGDQVDCPVLDELVTQVPLILTETGVSFVRIVVGEAESGGRRSVAVYARPAQSDDEWVCHATGVLTPEGPVGVVGLGVWPPVGAEVVSVGGVYEDLVGRGLEYGPVFRGVEGVWRR